LKIQANGKQKIPITFSMKLRRKKMIKWIKKKWNQFINWYTDGLDK